MMGEGPRPGEMLESPQSLNPEGQSVVGESSRTVIFLFVTVFMVALVPILFVAHPLQIDMPNHLARHYIASNIGLSDDLSRFYAFEWQAIPYLGGDALYQLLDEFLSIYDARRFVLAIVCLTLLGSAMLLHRVLWGSFSIWPLLCVLLFYNANVGMGFEGYLLGSSLALVCFVGWISWDVSRLGLKAIVFIPLATLLYFMHVFAFAVFGVLYLSYELAKHWGSVRTHPVSVSKRLSIIALPMLPGSVHFITGFLFSGAYGPWTLVFGGIGGRIKVLRAPVSAAIYDLPMDHIIVGCLIFIFVLGFTARRLSLHPSMKLVVIVLGGLSLAAPVWLHNVAYVHYRLPFLFVLLLIAASRPTGVQPVRYWAAAAALGLLIVVRTFMMLDYWKSHDIEVRELVQSFEKLDRGAILLTVGTAEVPRHWHSPALAVIERDAFVPTLFTEVTMLSVQPEFLVFRENLTPFLEIDSLAAALEAANDGTEYPPNGDTDSGNIALRSWWRDFSHVLVIDYQKSGNPFPDYLQLVHEGSYFSLYRSNMFESGTKD